jgi:hypothetical protein
MKTLDLKRTAKTYADIAKEPVRCEVINETLYTYGSELACLRLFHAMPRNSQGVNRIAHSDDLKTWYFALDL